MLIEVLTFQNQVEVASEGRGWVTIVSKSKINLIKH